MTTPQVMLVSEQKQAGDSGLEMTTQDLRVPEQQLAWGGWSRGDTTGAAGR